jgi:aryl-alcohol dehydrogenase-like predicted oxidoreductase
MDIPKRSLGKTGIDATIMGLGGEGVLRTFGQEKEAEALINRAIDLGITYFESARAYSGSESATERRLRKEKRCIPGQQVSWDKGGA